MIKAVLQYTDCLGDKRIVNDYLVNNFIRIINTRKGDSIYPKVTILVESEADLREILIDLKQNTLYGVTLVKMRELKSNIMLIKAVQTVLLILSIYLSALYFKEGNFSFALWCLGIAGINSFSLAVHG